MRVVFMGTPPFAATILRYLADQHDVVGVFTRPDTVRARGKELVASPVKNVALQLGLPVFEFHSLRSRDAHEELEHLAPDVICVAAYGALLPAEVLELPPYGCLNVHASLLPRWRGAAPIERAILAGDDEVGVCVMKMEEGLDTGDFTVVRSLEPGDMNTEELTCELADLGASALLVVLQQMELGSISWTKQDELSATYAEKIAKDELNVHPSLEAGQVLRQVRASSMHHPAKCQIAGKDVTLVRVALPEPAIVEALSAFSPGSVVFQHKRLYLICADGGVEVLEVKPAGKTVMSGDAFACGLQGIKQGGLTWGPHA